MFDNVKKFSAVALLMLPLLTEPGGAAAATMNFANLPDEGAQLQTYSENGIKATALGGVLAYDFNPGYAHIDDSGTGLASGIDFTMSGLFSAAEFSLVSFGYNFFGAPGPLTDNLFVTGFVGNNAVASSSYILSDIFGATQTIGLGAGFAAIDRLRIELRYPVNTTFCDAPCAHFDLDYVTLNGGLAAVPLPATALLLGASALGLVGAGRRRRALRG